jgi:nucleotide-binding universal stress UspA family protein
MKVLIAIDGTPVSEAAMRAAIDRPWPGGSEFKILTVVEPPIIHGSVMILNRFSSEGHEMAEKEITKAIYLLASLDRIVTHTVREGIADEEIVKEAKEWGADLILVGTHGRYGRAHKLLGSVAEKVAAGADCSVEIVRNSLRKKFIRASNKATPTAPLLNN